MQPLSKLPPPPPLPGAPIWPKAELVRQRIPWAQIPEELRVMIFDHFAVRSLRVDHKTHSIFWKWYIEGLLLTSKEFFARTIQVYASWTHALKMYGRRYGECYNQSPLAFTVRTPGPLMVNHVTQLELTIRGESSLEKTIDTQKSVVLPGSRVAKSMRIEFPTSVTSSKTRYSFPQAHRVVIRAIPSDNAGVWVLLDFSRLLGCTVECCKTWRVVRAIEYQECAEEQSDGQHP